MTPAPILLAALLRPFTFKNTCQLLLIPNLVFQGPQGRLHRRFPIFLIFLMPLVPVLVLQCLTLVLLLGRLLPTVILPMLQPLLQSFVLFFPIHLPTKIIFAIQQSPPYTRKYYQRHIGPCCWNQNNSFSFSHNNVPINNIISEEETWYKRRRTSSYHDPLMVPVIYGTSISGPSGNNSLGVSRSERYKSAFSLAGSHRSILNSNEHPDHLSAINEAESSRQSSVSSNQTSEPNSHQGTVPAAVVERTESISNGQNGREIIRSSLSKFGSFGSVGSFGSFGPFGFGSFSEHGERSSSF